MRIHRHGETNNFPLLLPHRVIFAIPLFGQKVVSPVSMVVQNVRRLTESKRSPNGNIKGFTTKLMPTRLDGFGHTTANIGE